MSVALEPRNPVLGDATASPRIGPASAGVRMTPEEFDAIEDWDECYVYELIHGVLVVSPGPLEEERDPNEELGYWLRTYRDQHLSGKLLDATLNEHMIATPGCRRRADRVIWAGLGRKPKRKVDVPTIVVEFVSEGKRSWMRDYVEKAEEYLAAGVREYWIVDRFKRQLFVVRGTPAGPVELAIPETEIYRPDLLPGFELPVGRLLAVADAWSSQDRAD